MEQKKVFVTLSMTYMGRMYPMKPLRMHSTPELVLASWMRLAMFRLA